MVSDFFWHMDCVEVKRAINKDQIHLPNAENLNNRGFNKLGKSSQKAVY